MMVVVTSLFIAKMTAYCHLIGICYHPMFSADLCALLHAVYLTVSSIAASLEVVAGKLTNIYKQIYIACKYTHTNTHTHTTHAHTHTHRNIHTRIHT